MIEIIASDLKKVLDSLNSVISTKGLVDNSDKFVFDKDKIYAFNGDIFVAVRFDTGLRGAVPGVAFYKLIDRYGTNKVELLSEGEIMKVRKGKSVCQFPFDSSVDCPIPVDIKKWKDVPENFLAGLNICNGTTGNDYTDMRTVCIHVKDKVLESSDSFRISHFEMDSKIKDDFFIPNNVVPFLSRSKPIRYFCSESWVYYENVDKAIVCHRNVAIGGDYPDLGAVIKDQGDYRTIDMPEKLYDSIEKAKVFLESEAEQNKFVRISCKSGKLTLTGEGNMGNYKDVIKVGFDEELEFLVHPDFMMHAIERSNSILVNDNTMRIESPNCVGLVSLAK